MLRRLCFPRKQAERAFPSSSCQSIGVGVYGCADLANVTFDAEKVKVGNAAFAGCKKLTSVSINAVVISPYAFNGCTELSKVTLGKDVSVIGEYAFAGTKVAKFRLDPANTALSFKNGDDSIIYKNNGTQLLLAAPASATTRVTTDATSISTGAFSGNTNLISVVANNVTEVGDYAFSDCAALAAVTMNKLKSAGNYAFFNTAITKLPNAAGLTSVGDYAFAGTRLSSVAVPDNANVGNYAFAGNGYLKNATLGNGVTLGEGAFFKTALVSVTAGSNAKIGAAAFNS
ncbi:MAG: leucine-rich repeat domain-containing protein [Christensenellaceae bacterium]